MATTTYPHQNHSLVTIKGERWKDIPALEGYYKISNMGRVKRLEYEMEYKDGRIYIKPEMIIKPAIISKINKQINENNRFLVNRVKLNGIKHNLTISRLVYYCFREPFDLDDKGVLILCKDGDGLNVHPGNLIKTDLSGRSQRMFERGRGHTPFGNPDAPWAVKQRAAIAKTISKQVSRYNAKGKRLKIYTSCTAAQIDTGVFSQSIGKAAANPGLRAGNYYWAWGKEKQIDLDTILKERLNRNRLKHGISVTQYNTAGIRVAVYPSIQHASEATGAAASSIRLAIKGVYKSVKGFIWKKGYGKTTIEMDGYLWGRASAAQQQSKPVQQFTVEGKLVKQYSSIREASLFIQVHPTCIVNVCKGTQQTAAGYKWKYAPLKRK